MASPPVVVPKSLSHIALLAALSVCSLAAAPLTIEIIEGQNAINNVTRNTAYEPVIEVRDANGRPVAAANVTFTLPGIGPSGAFTDGSKALMIQTDSSGRATARGLRPNNQVGQFEIRVTASSAGQTGNAIVTQTNAAPASTNARSGKKLAIILGILGGGAAAVAVAVAGGGSSSAPPSSPSADIPVGSITPGAPGFGPPR